MHPEIQQQLDAHGEARAVVVLHHQHGLVASGDRPILGHFRRREGAGLAAGVAVGPVYLKRLELVIGYVDPAGAQALDARDDVREVHPPAQLELVAPAASAPTTPVPGLDWGLEAIGIPELWSQGLTGKGVGVAHLDTGVDATHPALAGRVVSFVEFDDRANPLPGKQPYDSGTHGTHTAGTVAGKDINGLKIGVAPDAELHCGRVIEYQDPLVQILAGMDWALGQGVRVLSSSLGIKGYNPFLVTVMDRLRAAGILPIVAVGNEGADPGHPTRSPANYPNSMAVGAVDSDGQVAYFSSYGPADGGPVKPDVVAPGIGITSAVPGGGAEIMDGSSMATPHVAGLAALLFQRKPDATVDEVQAAILSTATACSGDPQKFGHGLVHGPAALDHLLKGTGQPAAT
jgi:subtilisin family serine protease